MKKGFTPLEIRANRVRSEKLNYMKTIMNDVNTVSERISRRGFTLIELLIVIGILAILATTVVLVLNPAQLLAETRDVQRLSDLDTIRTALNLYLATASGPTFPGGRRCTGPAVAAAPCAEVGAVISIDRTTAGLGWVNVNLGAISGGSPIPLLPLDPNGITAASQTAALHYSFKTTPGTTLTYELTAQMESAKYSNPTVGNKESNDGGNNDNCYEVGNDLFLIALAEC